MGKLCLAKTVCFVATFCIIGTIAAQSQQFQTFPAAGEGPNGLVQGTDGNFYGTSADTNLGNGTVFKMASTGTVTTLYTFCTTSGCPDGKIPQGALVEGPDGNFYGVTQQGGAKSQGVVFRITPSGGLTTIYSFCSLTNCADGSSPVAGLVLGPDGNLYGTTLGGGANHALLCGSGGCGTAFKITTAGILTTLYSFCSQTNCTDGLSPAAPLALGSDGNFYGMTLESGNQVGGGGTVFQLKPAGTLTTLYTFCSLTNCTDGASPRMLVQGTEGDLYGITAGGGANAGGTFFSITHSGVLTTLYSFCALANCADGQTPIALVEGTDGDFYGVTYLGGTPVHPIITKTVNCSVADSGSGCGTFYRLTSTGTLTTLWNFCAEKACDDGAFPYAAPIQASNGVFYSTATFGGTTCSKPGCGTIFSWSADVLLAPTFTPSPLSFSTTKLDTVSKVKNVVIRNVNTATATLDFSGFSVSGPFAISATTCGATLAAGKTCKVSLTFTPTVEGTSTGTLSVIDNAPGSPQTVSLSGTGD
jgi:uncharacterized repeat protein (TIGR03803 family)